ncbi:MAG: tetratricopeptide repeat protein [Balneolales bacterium]
MLRYIIFVLLLLVIGLTITRAQITRVDHLESQLVDADDFKKIDIYIDLMSLVEQDQPEQALSYSEKAQEILRLTPVPVKESLLLIRMGWANYYLNQYDIATELNHQGEVLAKSTSNIENVVQSQLLQGRLLRDKGEYEPAISILEDASILAVDATDAILKAGIYNELGSIYRRKGDTNRALEYHTDAFELIKETDKPTLAKTLVYLGINHDLIGNYDEALRFHLQALGIHEELKDLRGMATGMTNMGIIHQQIGQYDEAMNLYERSLIIWEELGSKDALATTRNNMGVVQEMLGEYEMALMYYKKAYDSWNDLGNTLNLSIALSNMGAMHSLMGNHDEGFRLKRQALKNQLELGDIRGSSVTYYDIALSYLKTERPDSALDAANQSLKLALETESWTLIRNTHELLSEIYENIRNYEQSLEHYKLYKSANDSLFNSNSQTIIADLQEQYNSRQQLQRIELLLQDKELQKLWLIILLGGFIFMMIVSLLIYNRHKLKMGTLRSQEQLNQAELEKERMHSITIDAKSKLLQAENERKDMELKAARDLQLSMLPVVLPESKYACMAAKMDTAAEVGGDYYDVDISDNGALTFCIGDATGHGTKAGTLVTVMKSLFNLISQENDLTESMHRCSSAIKKMKLPKLYMAFAMARLTVNKLEIIGAGMPAALVYRAYTGKVEQIELKGMPLGSVIGYPYTQKEITMHEEDVLVMLSDGFSELRANGGEMLGYDKQVQLLADTGSLQPQDIIDQFRKTAFEWLQSSKPNDDMTFVVLKMKKIGVFTEA